MAAPTLNTIVPTEGLSIGKTYVKINGSGFNTESSGGTVRVLFGGVESPRYGVVSDSLVIAQSPGGDVGPVDVTVENVGPGGAPVEPTTLAGAFSYKRPSLATIRGGIKTLSCATLVTERLVIELRRTVLENTSHDTHPEYVDPFGATVEEEKQSTHPSLKLLGPNTAEDRFYSLNGDQSIDLGGGEFQIVNQPVTLRLDYQIVGVGRSTGEVGHLHVALMNYFNQTPRLDVPVDGVDPLNGVVSYEIQPSFEDRGDFLSNAKRDGVYQFAMRFSVRGVDVAAHEIFEGRETTEVVPETVPHNP